MSSSTVARAGRMVVLIVSAFLFLDAALPFLSPAFIAAASDQVRMAGNVRHLVPLLAFACALLLAIPATSPLGAVLTTGFLGGAIAAHLMIGEIGSPPQIVCVLLGLATWAGLLMCDKRLREAAPFRRRPARSIASSSSRP